MSLLVDEADPLHSSAYSWRLILFRLRGLTSRAWSTILVALVLALAKARALLKAECAFAAAACASFDLFRFLNFTRLLFTAFSSFCSVFSVMMVQEV